MALLPADEIVIFGPTDKGKHFPMGRISTGGRRPRDTFSLLGIGDVAIYPAVIHTQEEIPNMKPFLALKADYSGSDSIRAISIVIGTDEVDAIQRNQLSGTWYLVEVQEVGTAIVAKKPASPVEIEQAHEGELSNG